MAEVNEILARTEAERVHFEQMDRVRTHARTHARPLLAARDAATSGLCRLHARCCPAAAT